MSFKSLLITSAIIAGLSGTAAHAEAPTSLTQQMFGSTTVTVENGRTAKIIDRCVAVQVLATAYYGTKPQSCSNKTKNINGRLSVGWAIGTTHTGEYFEVQFSDARLNAISAAASNPTADVSLEMICPQQATAMRKFKPVDYTTGHATEYLSVQGQECTRCAPQDDSRQYLSADRAALFGVKAQRPRSTVTMDRSVENQRSNDHRFRSVTNLTGDVIRGGALIQAAKENARRKPAVFNSVNNAGDVVVDVVTDVTTDVDTGDVNVDVATGDVTTTMPGDGRPEGDGETETNDDPGHMPGDDRPEGDGETEGDVDDDGNNGSDDDSESDDSDDDGRGEGDGGSDG